MVLSEAERRTFFDRRVLKIKTAFSAQDAAHMSDRIWNLLESDHGIHRDKPETWTLMQPTGFQSLTKAGIFNPIASPKIIDVLDDLLNPGGWRSQTLGERRW